MNKIRILVVDDSALVRKMLSEIINSQPDMEVIGTAPDPLIARKMIREMDPDIITLDVEMPKMDGLDFLERLMRLHPMPVLMISTLTEKGSEVTFRALELGAVDFIEKPKIGIASGLLEYSEQIAFKLRTAKHARIKRLSTTESEAPKTVTHPTTTRHIFSTEKLIIVGASTGGTEAIKDFLVQLPSNSPGILIAQHMPESFTKSFSERLDKLCKINVVESRGGERILPGHAFVAPGHSHLMLQRCGANYVTELSQRDPVNRHRPSVDVLFHSAAKAAGKNAIGVILTGMGKDGAEGMLAMHKAGAYNFAQDEASCVVYGMPKEAVATGGVDEIIPLQEMAKKVLSKIVNMSSHTVRV